MRRILISTVESYAEEYANCITAEKKNGLANWRKMPVDRLRELYYTLKWQGEYWLADYVLAIMQYLKEIVLLTPDDFNKFHEEAFIYSLIH